MAILVRNATDEQVEAYQAVRKRQKAKGPAAYTESGASHRDALVEAGIYSPEDTERVPIEQPRIEARHGANSLQQYRAQLRREPFHACSVCMHTFKESTMHRKTRDGVDTVVKGSLGWNKDAKGGWVESERVTVERRETWWLCNRCQLGKPIQTKSPRE